MSVDIKIGHPCIHLSSICQHFQTSSTKPLSRLKSNCIWSLHGLGEQKINIFYESTEPIEVKLHMEPPWVGGTKDCSQSLGHMTKMAARPIYCKNPLKFFLSKTKGPVAMGLGMQHLGHGPTIVVHMMTMG